MNLQYKLKPELSMFYADLNYTSIYNVNFQYKCEFPIRSEKRVLRNTQRDQRRKFTKCSQARTTNTQSSSRALFRFDSIAWLSFASTFLQQFEGTWAFLVSHRGQKFPSIRRSVKGISSMFGRATKVIPMAMIFDTDFAASIFWMEEWYSRVWRDRKCTWRRVAQTIQTLPTIKNKQQCSLRSLY